MIVSPVVVERPRRQLAALSHPYRLGLARDVLQAPVCVAPYNTAVQGHLSGAGGAAEGRWKSGRVRLRKQEGSEKH